MIYEYTNENLSREEIGDMLKESKSLLRNVKNITYSGSTIAFIVIFFLIAFTNDFRWDTNYFILIGAYVIGIAITFFKKDVNVKYLQEMIYKEKSTKRSIEFKENAYIYRIGKLNSLLNKHTIREIITSKEYTLIEVIPKKFKLFGTLDIFIPNNLFGSEEKYNEFINSIS